MTLPGIGNTRLHLAYHGAVQHLPDKEAKALGAELGQRGYEADWERHNSRFHIFTSGDDRLFRLVTAISYGVYVCDYPYFVRGLLHDWEDGNPIGYESYQGQVAYYRDTYRGQMPEKWKANRLATFVVHTWRDSYNGTVKNEKTTTYEDLGFESASRSQIVRVMADRFERWHKELLRGLNSPTFEGCWLADVYPETKGDES